MRDLLYKNLTSGDKRRKVIASSEVADSQGVHTIIRRHFICVAKEVKVAPETKPLPYLYVFRQRNTKEQQEKFFCKIKGSVYVASTNKLFLIIFVHSLKITLMPEEEKNFLTKDKN